jgi:hypothetical protein
VKNLILFLVFMVVTCTSVHAQEKKSPLIPDQKAELERLSREWMDAMLAHDKPKLEELMGAEYSLRAWDDARVIGRAVWLDTLFNHLKIIRWE